MSNFKNNLLKLTGLITLFFSLPSLSHPDTGSHSFNCPQTLEHVYLLGLDANGPDSNGDYYPETISQSTFSTQLRYCESDQHTCLYEGQESDISQTYLVPISSFYNVYGKATVTLVDQQNTACSNSSVNPNPPSGAVNPPSTCTLGQTDSFSYPEPTNTITDYCFNSCQYTNISTVTVCASGTCFADFQSTGQSCFFDSTSGESPQEQPIDNTQPLDPNGDGNTIDDAVVCTSDGDCSIQTVTNNSGNESTVDPPTAGDIGSSVGSEITDHLVDNDGGDDIEGQIFGNNYSVTNGISNYDQQFQDHTDSFESLNDIGLDTNENEDFELNTNLLQVLPSYSSCQSMTLFYYNYSIDFPSTSGCSFLENLKVILEYLLYVHLIYLGFHLYVRAFK